MFFLFFLVLCPGAQNLIFFGLNCFTISLYHFCKTEALSTDVHTQVHHFDTRRLDQTLTTNHTKGWHSVPDAILPGHRRAHWWVPARTPTVHQCPQSGEVAQTHQKKTQNTRSSVKQFLGNKSIFEPSRRVIITILRNFSFSLSFMCFIFSFSKFFCFS